MEHYVRQLTHTDCIRRLSVTNGMYNGIVNPNLTPAHQNLIQGWLNGELPSLDIEVAGVDTDTDTHYSFNLSLTRSVDEHVHFRKFITGQWLDFIADRNLDRGNLVEFRWSAEPYWFLVRVMQAFDPPAQPQWGIPLAVGVGVVAAALVFFFAIKRYTKVVLAVASGKVGGGSFVKLATAAYTLGAMTPCLRSYVFLCQKPQSLMDSNAASHPYKKWINKYSSDGLQVFMGSAKQFEDLLNKLIANKSYQNPAESDIARLSSADSKNSWAALSRQYTEEYEQCIDSIPATTKGCSFNFELLQEKLVSLTDFERTANLRVIDFAVLKSVNFEDNKKAGGFVILQDGCTTFFQNFIQNENFHVNVHVLPYCCCGDLIRSAFSSVNIEAANDPCSIAWSLVGPVTLCWSGFVFSGAANGCALLPDIDDRNNRGIEALFDVPLEECGAADSKESSSYSATQTCTDFRLPTALGKVGVKGLGKLATPFVKTEIAAYTLGAIKPYMRLYTFLGQKLWALMDSDAGSHPCKKSIDNFSSDGSQAFMASAKQIEDLLDKLIASKSDQNPSESEIARMSSAELKNAWATLSRQYTEEYEQCIESILATTKGGLDELNIHANEFSFEESISTGEIIKKVVSPFETLKVFEEILSRRGDDKYIGDSIGDLLCLVKADVGIVVGSSSS